MRTPHTSPSPPAPPEELSNRLVESFQPLAGVVACVMGLFIVYNAVDLPSGVREPAMVYDAVCVLAFGSAWLGLRRESVARRHIYPFASGLTLLLLGNTLMVELLMRAPFYSLYVGVFILGIAATMTVRRWAFGTIAAIWVLQTPILWLSSEDPQTFGRFAGVLGAITAVAVAIFVSRIRKERKLAEQRRALEGALEDAQRARANLDAIVEERTLELRSAIDALLQEIDERERAEGEARELLDQLRHAQRLESVGRLAGGVAHDFNNLLAVILSNLDLALEDVPVDGDREILDDARLAAERAMDVTRQLLAFSRKQVMEKHTFDVVARIDDMHPILNRLLGDDVRLDIRSSAGSAWIDGDPSQIEQVIMNLVVNARDATPEGGVVEIEVDRIARDGAPAVRIRVVDEGMGIDVASQNHIFEPFFTTKPRGKGTGLGLSTAYGICKQHGGVIGVTSAKGEGSTFDVLLPSVAAPRESITQLAAAQEFGGSETVLIVEDEPAVRRAAERMLRRLGYDVLAAGSGPEAISLMRDAERTVELLWTDVQMPGMSGIELAETLGPDYPELKVLYVSGYTGDYLKSHGSVLREGVNFIYKPFRTNEIGALLRRILDSDDVVSVAG